MLQETYTLANGTKLPKLGLGTWFIDDDKAAQAVRDAVALGYRLIDTGEGVRTCGAAREELFVASKVAAELKTYESAAVSIDETLQKMGLDYPDQMIIHFPQPWNEFRVEKRYFEENREVWRALEDAQASGKVRVIGVSNFLQDDLESLFAGCRVRPHGEPDPSAYHQHRSCPRGLLPEKQHSGRGVFTHCARRSAEKPGDREDGGEIRRVRCAAVHPLRHPARHGRPAQDGGSRPYEEQRGR